MLQHYYMSLDSIQTLLVSQSEQLSADRLTPTSANDGQGVRHEYVTVSQHQQTFTAQMAQSCFVCWILFIFYIFLSLGWLWFWDLNSNKNAFPLWSVMAQPSTGFSLVSLVVFDRVRITLNSDASWLDSYRGLCLDLDWDQTFGKSQEQNYHHNAENTAGQKIFTVCTQRGCFGTLNLMFSGHRR